MKRMLFVGAVITCLVVLLLSAAAPSGATAPPGAAARHMRPAARAGNGAAVHPTGANHAATLAKAQSESRAARDSLAKGGKEKGVWSLSFSSVAESWTRGTVFKDHLYVSYDRFNDIGEGAQIFRTSDGETWEEVIQPAFGNDLQPYGMFHCTYFHGLYMFKGMLYASMGWWYTDNATFWEPKGGQLWRTADGVNWEKVIDFAGDPFNDPSFLAEFRGELYATTTNFLDGFEVWSSPSGDAGDWTKIADNSFNTYLYPSGTPLFAYQDKLFVIPYGLVSNETWTDQPVHIWYTEDGATWNLATEDGFGDPRALYAWTVMEFKGDFYVQLDKYDPVTGRSWNQIMRTSNGVDWTVFCEDCRWIGNVIKGHVYEIWYDAGPVVWRTADLVNWEQLDWGGFTDPDIVEFWLIAEFKGDLYFFGRHADSVFTIWRCTGCK